MSARKDDKNKPPMSLIPRSALIAEAKVMGSGAKRYGPHNWRGGMKWSRLIDAAMRHILAFADGEDIDDGPDGTGESHLANARCCLAFLIEYQEAGLGEDDRHCTDLQPEGDEGAEGPNFVCEPGEHEVQLVELNNGPEAFWRLTVDGAPIFGMPNSVLPEGALVWVRRDRQGNLHFVERFAGLPA